MTARLHSSVPPPAEVVARLVGDAVASRIAECDPTLWPGAARPGWVTAPRASRPLVGEIEGLRERLRVAGQVRVVLAATGGVGVAAEVLADVDSRLIVLDTTDPAQVADALAGDLGATVLVVSEETSTISVASHGLLHRHLTAPQVRDLLSGAISHLEGGERVTAPAT